MLNNKFKDNENNINIEEVKKNLSNEIIDKIRNEKVDLDKLALNMGISKENLMSTLINTYSSHGSELLLINDNINRIK